MSYRHEKICINRNFTLTVVFFIVNTNITAVFVFQLHLDFPKANIDKPPELTVLELTTIFYDSELIKTTLINIKKSEFCICAFIMKKSCVQAYVKFPC